MACKGGRMKVAGRVAEAYGVDELIKESRTAI